MDRSLWLLTRLRAGALYRRWRRSLSHPKGIVVSVVGALLIVPSLGTMIAMLFFAPPTYPTDLIERFGPAGFAAGTLFLLLMSTGEVSLYYSPAEVAFLFSGPYRRRQLVAYKLVMLLLTALSTSVIFGFSSTLATPRLASAFCGSLLAVVFIQLAQIVLGLTFNLMGTLAWSRARRVALAIGLGLALVALVPSRASLLATDWKAVGLDLERSPVTIVALTPFRWFIRAFTAPTWSSLAGWSSLALGVDLALVGLVFALDAGYLEAASGASARRYDQYRKAIGGGGGLKITARRTGRFRLRPPEPAWLGGVGPNLWRQVITAVGDPAQVVTLILVVGVGSWLLGLLLPPDKPLAGILLPVAMSLSLLFTFFLSWLICFDFRGDLDVMETLKMLPIRPARLALGQVLTPSLLATVVQWVSCLAMVTGAGWLPGGWVGTGGGLALLIPANLFFFVVENLLFLWYPTRVVAGQFDGMAVVRQMLLLFAKGVAIGLAAILVLAVAAATYLLNGERPGPALLAAWITLTAATVGLMPLLGRAFARFDVSRDLPA